MLKPNAVSALQCAPGHLKLTLPSQPPLRSGGQEDLCRLWTATHCRAGESEVSKSSGKEDPRTSQGSLGDDVNFWTVLPAQALRSCGCSGEDIETFILLLSCLDRSLFRELLHPHLPYSQRNLPVPEEYPGQLQYELVSRRSAQGVSPKGQGASSLPHALTNTVFPFC